MVKEGNVRLDISISESVYIKLREKLMKENRLKKGAISSSFEESMKNYLSQVVNNCYACNGTGKIEKCMGYVICNLCK